MPSARFRFYAELNDFLPPARRQQVWERHFLVSPTVKDMVQAMGVPHTEIDLLLANGRSVDLDYRVQDGDYISVYPMFESLDITPLLRVRPQPLRSPRFVLDIHLGRLTAYLRMAGFDALYRNDYRDDELARVSAEERRIVLTRDRGLLKRNQVMRGYWVRATEPRQQLAEVLQRFDLFGQMSPFSRCLRCNGVLQAVRKEEVADRLLPDTLRRYDEFALCPDCGRVYWKGSHYERMRKFMDWLVL